MFRKVIAFLLGLILVSSCRLTESEQQARISETPIPSPASTKTPLPPTSTLAIQPTNLIDEVFLTPTALTPPEKEYQLCSPLAEHAISDLPGIVSDPYAPPPMGKDDRHQGVDFAYYNQGGRASIEGEGVTAILPGRVAALLNDRLPYGNMVMIETQRDDLWPELIQGLEIAPDESLYHLYAHLGQSPLVSLGQPIECGQRIGEAGKTGYNVPVPHLHLEIRIGPAGNIFESMAFYDTRATAEEMDNYKLWRMSGTFRHLDPMRIFTEYWLEPSESEK